MSARGHGARSRAGTDPANLPGRAPLPTLQFIRTFRWRSQPSRLDRPLAHEEGAAADGRGNETPGGDLGREMDEARPAHLVALLDRERVGAVAQAAREHAGKGGGRRSGRGIFRDTHAGGEHAAIKMVTRPPRLPAL